MVHSCSARFQGSSHASPGCTGSQWLGNTPGFSCSDTRVLKTPIGKVFQPCSASRTAHDGSLAITDLLWDRPHADPQPWQHCQHPWFPWQLQNAKFGAGAHHSISSFPWLLQEWVARSGAAHSPLGVGHCMARASCRGFISEPLCRKGTLPPSREAHVDIFSRSARQTSSALPAIHLLCVFWAPQPFQIN